MSANKNFSEIPTLKFEDASLGHRPWMQSYKIFYSSWWGGFTNDPRMMTVPMDDHMVHRGDAVFEAIKAIGRRVFLLEEHLKRLEVSCSKLGIPLPLPLSEIKELILEALRRSEVDEGLIRLFISRGPGDFSPNPYASVGSQIYLMITDFKAMSPEKYAKGVKIGRTSVASKEGWMAQVKSCNYLLNVMMKKEAVDRGFDFLVGFDSQGELQEGPTENIFIVNKDGVLTHPPFHNILKGTTMIRFFELAHQILRLPTQVAPLKEADLLTAKEAYMVGTTLDVIPITQYESKTFPVGDRALRFREVLIEDQKKGIVY